MKDIKIYTTEYCWFCNQAKSLLNQLGLSYEETRLDDKPELRKKLSDENNGFRTVPMIFVDDKFVGGYQELISFQKGGGLS